MLKGLSRKLLLSHMLTSVLVIGSVGVYFYMGTHTSLKKNLQTRLLDNAMVVSESIDVAKLDLIRDEHDMESDAYREVISSLTSFTRLSRDIAHLYIMRLDDGQVRFVVDSTFRPNQSKPGELYEGQLITLREGFKNPSVDDDVNPEKGSFLSGYAPIRAGAHEYVIGVDMAADGVVSKFSELKTSAILYLLFAVLLTFLFSHLLSRGFTRRVHATNRRCEALEKGEQIEGITIADDAELSSLIQAFSRMNENLQKGRVDRILLKEELRHANEKLEQRVVARTRELLEANRDLNDEVEERKGIEEKRTADFRELKAKLDKYKALTGLLPICASCKQIRDDDGHWIQLEAYIEAHTDVVFSHGICPDCIEKLYPVKQPTKNALSGVPFMH